MHYQLEVVMPKVKDIDKTIKEILAPYGIEEDNGFYDYYVIGGRYSGSKIMKTLNQEKLEMFNKRLKEEKITVSPVIAGKQSLSPSNQIDKVDGIWRDMFPEFGISVCPIFDHSDSHPELIKTDIMEVKNVHSDLSMARIIFAFKESSGEVSIDYMLEREYWNGVNFQETIWDGTFAHAFKLFKGYREKDVDFTDFISVTIDYHS